MMAQTIRTNEDNDSYRTINTWISELKKQSVLQSEMYDLFLENTRYCTYFKCILVLKKLLDISKVAGILH